MYLTYMPLPNELFEEMELLTAEEYGRLIRAGQQYILSDGKEPELTGNERYLWKRLKLIIDRYEAVEREKVEEKSKAGKKGAKKRWGAGDESGTPDAPASEAAAEAAPAEAAAMPENEEDSTAIKNDGRNSTAINSDSRNSTPMFPDGRNSKQNQTKPNLTKPNITNTTIKDYSSPPASGPGDSAPAVGLGEVMSAFFDRINPQASHASVDELKAYVEELGGEVCLRAIDTAVDNGSPNWRYIQGILRNCAQRGIKSLAEWDRQEARRIQEKAQKAKSSGPGKPSIDRSQSNGVPGQHERDAVARLIRQHRGEGNGQQDPW